LSRAFSSHRPRRNRRSPAGHIAYPDPRSSRAESDVPDPSFPFPGRFRSRVQPLANLTRQYPQDQRTSRSAAAAPLRSSACSGHFSKDGAIAVPRPAPLPSGRVPRPGSSRNYALRAREEHSGRSGGGLAHLSPKGDTPAREKETPGEEQLAAGSRRKAQSACAERGGPRAQGSDAMRHALCISAMRLVPRLGNREIRRELTSSSGLTYLDSHRLRACRRR